MSGEEGLLADRPNRASGAHYFATDVDGGTLYYDDGDGWKQVTGTGGGGVIPPAVITGTDPATSPLSVGGASGQTAPVLKVIQTTTATLKNSLEIDTASGAVILSVNDYGDFLLAGIPGQGPPAIELSNPDSPGYSLTLYSGAPGTGAFSLVTPTSSLLIESSGAVALTAGDSGAIQFALNAPTGQSVNVMQIATVDKGNVFVVASNGTSQIAQAQIQGNDPAQIGLTMYGRNAQTAVHLHIENYNGDRLVEIDANGTLRVTPTTAGKAPVIIGASTIPPDGDLLAGQAALWFDDTNGASKLMVKAKQADGTVRTGSLALS